MGTRHLTVVVHNKKVKVAQYGQWDGYPTGQGETIVNFITKKMKKKKFIQKLSKLRWTMEEDDLRIQKEFGIEGQQFISTDIADKIDQKYPYLSRDTGGEILQMIQETNVPFIQNSIDFAKDSLFCEYAYVVDLDNDILEVYQGFAKRPGKKTERFYSNTPDEGGYYPIRLKKKYEFSELNENTMKKLSSKLR